ncbi:hypothetical protein [Heliophilum fasciatum]|uniref:Uncharacterized protein n=1 Tax=Heliophilum fasciatum TaxID=35700 RepID=A0A4R2S4H0_9FIRM|nr:hypothetical protein [Heliophilum fasciatum]MCW2277415.1 hypothetical protein [Heliophilum fasciatum]TCP67251.1 hypothetical protein EDD73_105149 [Heliophilum fasciatum]
MRTAAWSSSSKRRAQGKSGTGGTKKRSAVLTKAKPAHPKKKKKSVERASDQHRETQQQDWFVGAGTDAAAVEFEPSLLFREDEEPEKSGKMAELGKMLYRNLQNMNLDQVLTEVNRLKTNAEKVEVLLREADQAMNSLVGAASYLGIKPKEGTWAYNRYRRVPVVRSWPRHEARQEVIEQEVIEQEAQITEENVHINEAAEATGDSSSSFDLSSILDMASLLMGGSGDAGDDDEAAPKASKKKPGITSFITPGLMGELLKTPGVQSMLISAIGSFLKKK